MKKSPLSVRIIHVLSVIVFWLLVMVTAVSFIGNLLLEFGVIGDEFQLRIALPATFSVHETGTMPLFGETSPVQIEQATGRLHIIDTPVKFSKVVLRILLLVLTLVLFMSWKFKTFITNIKNGEIFAIGNINNLKHIAYGILALWLITKLYTELLYHMAVKYIDFQTISIDRGATDKSDMLVIALLLWVLAHVFMKGVEMKKEQELTI